MLRMGIDVGGTKIEAIVLDEQGQEIMRQRVATPQNNYPAILQAIHKLINDIEASIAQQATLGFGTPGALTEEGVLKNSNTVVANGKPILADLQALLGRKIRMMNDANCFALSEAVDGVGQGCDVVFGVILGTGVGGGIVVNGNILLGANRIAGEWGHNPLPWPGDDERPGPNCYCGRQGCIETYLSGSGMSFDYLQVTGNSLSADEIVQLAASADANADRVLSCYEDRLARALAHVINVLDPNIIVLGGGLSNISRLYATVPKLWGEYVFSDKVRTQLSPPKFGDSSGVRGAAWLWDQ